MPENLYKGEWLEERSAQATRREPLHSPPDVDPPVVRRWAMHDLRKKGVGGAGNVKASVQKEEAVHKHLQRRTSVVCVRRAFAKSEANTCWG